MSNVLTIGIAGLGTVGLSCIELLQKNTQLLTDRSGVSLKIVRLANRSAKNGLENYAFDKNVLNLATASDIDVVVELIGGIDIAKQLVEQALANGKHVVTANKALLAFHGNELFALASENNVQLLYEAAVAGTIPIIKGIRDGLSANTIYSVAGIINGTSNYILTAMEQRNWSFQQALEKAQALGYAEADPTFDIDGTDAAHKLALLAALAFDMQVDFDNIYTQGIDQITIDDISTASELGYRIKHLGIASIEDGVVSMRVHPVMLPKELLIAAVDGAMNAVMVQNDYSGLTMHYGAGAGGNPTAAAVVSDLVQIGRKQKNIQAPINQREVGSIDSIFSSYYLRMNLVDKPGVLNKITQYFSRSGLNLETVIQKNKQQQTVPIAIITDKVQEVIIRSLLERLQEMPEISDGISMIRIEKFEG